MPNGTPNPNVGKLYSEGSPTRIDPPTESENVRVTASYTFDFTRFKGRWFQLLRGKVFVELIRYTTRNLNAVDQISSNAAGDFKGPLDRMWQAIADFTGANFGAWLTYRRRILRDRVNWTLQMNVRNLLDENTIYPLFIVDRRDGTHRPDTAVYTLREPRTYVFTSTFRF